MPIPLLQPKLRKRHANPPHADALYGYGYNPSWPSILSVAHDEADGGALFVILDRPCALGGTGANLPLVVPEGAPLSILSAALLPVKLRVVLDGPVSKGAAWRWAGAPCDLFDPITGNYPNAASGSCADFPGPYVPPPAPAVVVALSGSGMSCSMQFDQPVTVLGSVPDDSILFEGVAPLAAGNQGPDVIAFQLAAPISPGSTWEINAQPGYISTPIAVPQSGMFA